MPNSLENAAKFCGYLDSDDQRVKALVRQLQMRWNICQGEQDLCSLTVLLLNLLESWYLDREGWVSVSRNKNFYTIPKRYNPLDIGYRSLVRTLDALVENKLIEQKIGFRDERVNRSFRTRIRPDARLSDLFVRLGSKKVNVSVARNYETILLRDSEKRLVDYEDTNETKEMRGRLTEYNEFLLSKKFGLIRNPLKLNERRRPLVRIFNNGRFDQGGRFYGGWWQNIPSEWRGLIVMEPFNTPTLEFDYSGLHVKLLYALEGIGFEGDPYLTGSQQSRSVQKLILLVALNADNKDNAIRAIQHRIKEEGLEWDKEQEGDVEDLIKMFRTFHGDLDKAGYFFSGYGIKLQYLDSQIAERVMMGAMKHDILVLPVHDSFVFAEPDKDKVVKLMNEAYERITKFEPGIGESKHSGEWIPLSEYMFNKLTIKKQEPNPSPDIITNTNI